MQELIKYIQENTTHDTVEIQNSITSMVCPPTSPISLSEDTLLNALKIKGGFFVLKLHYKDFEEELRSEKIKYKIFQAISVIVSYEDDGNCYKDIEKFVKYIHGISDEKQTSIFGVKYVEKLSEFPITILFSGILPINQLKMSVGKKIDTLIHSDDSYFIPRFKKLRDDISKEIGIPILPVLPQLDENLEENRVRLTDLHDGRVISEFTVDDTASKEALEIYLLKLFYIYKALAEEKQYL